MAPTLFTNLVLSLIGVLIAQWVYQDGEHIKNLEKTLLQLEKKLEHK